MCLFTGASLREAVQPRAITKRFQNVSSLRVLQPCTGVELTSNIKKIMCRNKWQRQNSQWARMWVRGPPGLQKADRTLSSILRLLLPSARSPLRGSPAQRRRKETFTHRASSFKNTTSEKRIEHRPTRGEGQNKEGQESQLSMNLTFTSPLFYVWKNPHKIVPHRSDLQPAVGCRQKQVGCVVGVRQLQHSLFETSLVSTKTNIAADVRYTTHPSSWKQQHGWFVCD